MERIILIRSLLILVFSITLLLGSSTIKEIDRIYKKIPYASKSETAKILHELENFYISSVVSSDRAGIVKSLKGIIKCQKLLGIDSKTYENELNDLIKKSSPKIDSTDIKKPEKIVKDPIPNKLDKTLSIKSISKKDETIIIKFHSPLTKSRMIFFEINRGGIYKDIYDLKANVNFKIPKISLKNVENVKIAQNRLGKVRIVLEDRKKIYSNAYIREGTLFIQVQKNPDTVTKAPIKNITKDAPVQKRTKYPTNTLYATSKTIVIDPGHGGKDGGAVGYKKYKEKDAVLKIAKMLQKKLSKKGYKVYLTREKDTYLTLSERTKFANKKKADLFISIHANASPKTQKLTLKGVETFFLSPAKTEKAKRIAAKENKVAVTSMNDISKNTLLTLLNTAKIIQSNKLAIDIQKGMLTEVRKKYNDVKDGGVREAPFYVLVGAQMPAVLVELGYITNPQEADRLFNPFYQKSLTVGIVNGIDNYFINNQ